MYFKYTLAYCIINSTGNNLLKAFPQASPPPHKIPYLCTKIRILWEILFQCVTRIRGSGTDVVEEVPRTEAEGGHTRE